MARDQHAGSPCIIKALHLPPLESEACRLRRCCKLCWRDRIRSTAECSSIICWHNVVGQQLRAAGYIVCCTSLHRAAGGTVRSTTARHLPFILFWLRWTGSLLDRRSAGMVLPAQVRMELLPASSCAKRSAWSVLWMVRNRQCPEDATDPSQGNRVVCFVLDDGYSAVLPGIYRINCQWRHTFAELTFRHSPRPLLCSAGRINLGQ